MLTPHWQQNIYNYSRPRDLRNDLLPSERQTVQDIFERQAALHRQRTAFISNQRQLTFYELNGQVNYFAHHLTSLGTGPGETVGVCIGNSLELVVALLGVLKTGAAFVGVDSAHPGARIEQTLADADCKSLILRRTADCVDGFGGRKVYIDEILKCASAGFANPERRSNSDSLLQAVYTSGSTGKPKGVLISVNSFLQKLKWIQDWCPVNDSDVLLMYRSIGVAAGAWDCFMGPMLGLPTVVVSERELRNPTKLWNILCDHQVSYFFASPMLLQAVLDEAERSKCSRHSLRLVTSSGEPLPLKTVRRWIALFPEVKLLDVYGCSEYSSAMVCDTSDVAGGAQGKMKWLTTKNTEVHILDNNLAEVEVGVTGEIHLSGSHLALGYLNDAAMTAERFVNHPRESGVRMFRTGDMGRRRGDGTIEMVGRNDDVVNIRGFRVGLAEVEKTLVDHEALKEGAVITWGEPDKLIACYVPVFPVSDSDLRNFLRQRLPGHMVPAFFFELDSLPRTLAGKLDRSALTERWQNRIRGSASDPPTTKMETKIAGIWCDVLEVNNIGINDSFLSVGGDSISAMRILSRINETFCMHLEISDLLNLPTIRVQALALETLLSN